MNALPGQFRSSMRLLCTISLLVFVLLQAGGCTAAGALAGAAVDQKKTEASHVDSTQWTSLDKGEKIQALLKDSTILNGRFGAIRNHFGSQYETEYSGAQAINGTLLPLGSRLTVKTRTKRVTIGTLVGFDVKPGEVNASETALAPGSVVTIYLVDDTSAGFRTRDLRAVTELATENGDKIDALALRQSVLGSLLPSPSTLVITGRTWRERFSRPEKRRQNPLMGDTSYIPLSQVDELRYRHDGMQTAGLAAGGTADVLIVGVVVVVAAFVLVIKEAFEDPLQFGNW